MTIMKKKVFALLLCGLPLMLNAQYAFDALQMSQTELRGTSRFQSMAGAFGALGGDLSTLTQNPAGIGVYRNSDLGLTLSLDFNSTSSGVDKLNETKFNVNNVGYVGAIRLNSEVVPNLNFGFTYNRLQSYNRHYIGGIANIPTSMSNYIADEFVNVPGYSDADMYWTDDFNPYFDGYAPWIAITTYDMPTNQGGYSGIINHIPNVNEYGNEVLDGDGVSMIGSHFQGLYGQGTVGNAYYEIDERGHADEYNIAFGGNVANKLYFGLDIGILDMDFKSYQAYEEELDDAYIKANDEDVLYADIINRNTRADWGLYNYKHTEGTGVNFKLGLIWRPTQALRLGAAFHTPTYYDMRDTYSVSASIKAYEDGNMLYRADKQSNDGYDYSSSYTISTPWRFMGSVAGVIGTSGIISLDYEYVANETMRIGDDRGNNYPDATADMKTYFKPSHIIRVGGEYRINPNWSLRAGYSYKTTQVEKGVDNYDYNINTSKDVSPSYQYDNAVHNITCGVGYRYKSIYTDLAYVHKMRESVYNAFSPINDNFGYEPNVSADVTDHNNRISLTLGVRF